MYEELALYIDGEFRQGSDGAGEDVINPATEERWLSSRMRRRAISTGRSSRRPTRSRCGGTPPPTSAAGSCGRPES